MSSRLRFVTVAAVFCAIAIAPALAGDINIPPYRNPLDPRVTFQVWVFDPPRYGVGLPDGPFFNPNDDCTMKPPQDATPIEALGGATGLWCLDPGESLVFNIPNMVNPDFIKIVDTQVKYFSDAIGTPPLVIVQDPISGQFGVPAFPSFAPSQPAGLPDPAEWYFGERRILPECPPIETVTIFNGSNGIMYIDQVVIDTWCVPAPGTAGFVLAAGLVALRRRRT